jgi:hypothetical protein
MLTTHKQTRAEIDPFFLFFEKSTCNLLTFVLLLEHCQEIRRSFILEQVIVMKLNPLIEKLHSFHLLEVLT